MTVELPAGSQRPRRRAGPRTSAATAGSATCRIKIGARRRSRSSRRPACTSRAAAGDITVDRATGDAEITTGSGERAGARARRRRGDQELQRRHLGRRGRRRPAGQRRQRRHRRRRAGAGVVAKTANGDVRLGEVVARLGRARDPASATLEVGIREGTAAWLDVHAAVGKVRNVLDAADAPGTSAETVEVRAPHVRTATSSSGQAVRSDAMTAASSGDRAPACASRTATTSCSTASTSTSPRARSSRCSARTAPARPPRSRSSPR